MANPNNRNNNRQENLNLPAEVNTLSNLMPGALKTWCDKYKVDWEKLLRLFFDQKKFIAPAANADKSLALVVMAIKQKICPNMRGTGFADVSDDAREAFMEIFTKAQETKAKADQKKADDEAKTKAKSADKTALIAEAVDMIPGIVRHGGDTTKYLANWRELVTSLSPEQHQALCVCLTKKEEKKEVAIAIILLAKIKNPAERRQAALAMKG